MKLPKGITKRSDGLYEARIMYHGIRKTLYNRDLDKLTDDFEDLKYQLKHKQYEEDSKLTIEQFSAIFMEKKIFDGIKQNTIKSYNQAINLHVLPELGKYRIADITKEQLRNFLSSLAEYADGTKNIVYQVVKGMFDMAFEEGYITRNVIAGLANPKTKKGNRANRNITKGKAFTNAQYEIVLEQSKNLATADLIRFTALTGLRCGEVRAIKYSDIDKANKVLTVQRSIDQHDNIDTTKSEAGTRIVPLTDEAIKIAYRQKFVSAQGFVFCDRNGQPYTYNYLASEMRKLNSLCRIVDKDFPKFSLHTFRHTFATKCANNGMIPKVLMGIMGHRSISMTMDYYAHQEMESAITEFKKVEGAF